MKPAARWFWLAGLLVVAAYWLWLKPNINGPIGYSGDLGTIELTRQIIADNLRENGAPTFVTSRLMAPTGISAAFFSWALERDWIGAYAWLWNRDFPWLWVYFGISLLIAYFGTGTFSRKMGLPSWAAWGLATLVVVFHVPRHFKTYHHYEHQIHHWVYVSLFLDAWIWQRFRSERKLSWNLEVWRLLLLGLCFGLAGYYWGPMVLEWALVRASLAAGLWRSGKGAVSFEWAPKRAVLPVVLGIGLFGLQLRWFLPLLKQVELFGSVQQAIGWSASLSIFARPLWGDGLFLWLEKTVPLFVKLKATPFDRTETVVTIGWLFWIPIIWAGRALKKKRGGRGVGAIGPFLAFLVLVICYFAGGSFRLIQDGMQAFIPFMKYFRVTSRMGLYLVPIAGVLLALLWPELVKRSREAWSKPGFRVALLLFAVSSLFELRVLATPVTKAPGMSASFQELLQDLRARPGREVLDLPFCVAGGNGVCTDRQCPNYPMAVVGQVLTAWHDKRVYGIYEARLTEAQCGIYDRKPFQGWFEAWRQQRCFQGAEWDDFCAYLDSRAELSAVLVYPGIWRALQDPACRKEFEERLGAPVRESEFVANIERGNTNIFWTSVIWFNARCKGEKLQ